ncbi:His-Me finger endonuclease [Gonapodya prolifera JEL478]|uniref:Endonuclease n=1 Tax=Gonapodya prolifera (strain JEL478) TaxID=1344416 RepID=A0A139ANN8_GONPJ|nr:His-Me finger endonuclease [Gonapodya prolifera JEL478]|eukprot:KXS18371.1 His-Me finger endonuclease [Gonapodya prolifera JEL478]
MAGNATMAFIFAAGIATGLGLATIGGGISTSKTSGQVSPPSHNPSIPALSVSDSSTPNRPSTLTATSPSNTRHSFAIAANPADPIANADRILVHGAPSSPVEPVLPKSAYVVAYNKRTGNPLWVAQRFSKVTPLLEVPELPATVSDDTSEVGDQEEGTGQLRPATRGHTFRSDPLLPQLFRVSPSSYTSSGFDRGHMVPRADVANAAVGAGFSPVETAKCVEETYLMTNISPQYPSFNRHIWSRLESFVRRAASTYSDLVVITGPAWVPIWHVDKKKWRIEYEVMAPPPNVSDSSGALNSTAPPTNTVTCHVFSFHISQTTRPVPLLMITGSLFKNWNAQLDCDCSPMSVTLRERIASPQLNSVKED